MSENTKGKIIPLSLSLVVVILDQLTKFLVVKFIPRFSVFADDAVIELCGKYLRLIHVRNKAIAFSMGSNLSTNVRGVLFIILPLLVVVAVYVIYFRNNDFSKLQRWAICGILGGGIGNLIDRFFRAGGVVDFIDCYFFGILGMERWPTFNVADSAVVVCGILFVVTFLLQVRDDIRTSKREKQEN